jgi:MFS family permease
MTRVKPAAAEATPHVPRTYWLWLSGTTLSLVGTQVLAFGMAWTAARQSGVLTGLVLTMINLPRVLLLLFGGAVADRFGAYKVVVLGDMVMIAVTLGLALALLGGAPGALLLAVALAIGTVDAFYLPASGAMPRLLTAEGAVPRALAARQLAGQFAAFIGAPLGGALVAIAGLTAAAIFDAATFAVMLLILALIRPRPIRTAPAGSARKRGLWQDAWDGLRVAAQDKLLRVALLLVIAAAGLLLPVASLLVPLIGQRRDWSAATAGVVVGAIALGTSVVALIVLARRASSRPGLVGPAGLLVAALGVAALALPAPPQASAGFALLIGVGTCLFTAHIGPLILTASAASHISRLQAVLGLAQSLPLLLSHSALGALADGLGVTAALLACAGGLAVAASLALASPRLTGVRAGWGLPAR